MTVQLPAVECAIAAYTSATLLCLHQSAKTCIHHCMLSAILLYCVCCMLYAAYWWVMTAGSVDKHSSMHKSIKNKRDTITCVSCLEAGVHLFIHKGARFPTTHNAQQLLNTCVSARGNRLIVFQALQDGRLGICVVSTNQPQVGQSGGMHLRQ